MIKKILKFSLIIFSIIFTSLILLFAQPWVFLPHKHISISLPFSAEYDSTTSLIPMGEKIEHNASNGTPDGHPGIDFGFKKVTPIIAVTDGIVMEIKKNDEGSIDVTVSSGFYKTVYKEMNSVEKDIRTFKKIKQGELIGYSGVEGIRTTKPQKGDPSGQIHWEFSSSSMVIDRLCPLTYFDEQSRKRIEAIWNSVSSNDRFKSQYPEICNGIFKDKVE